jgi:hypothetical protein
MSIILSAIILILLIVIYYLYNQNRTFQVEDTNNKEIEEDPQIDQSFESTYYVLDNIKITKKVAIDIVNAALGRKELSKHNTRFSNLNKAKPIWWFDIPPAKFKDDLHLILAKNKGFIWIKISKGVIVDLAEVFRIRDDNGFVELKISSEPGVYYLRDIASGASGFNFEQYIKKEFD